MLGARVDYNERELLREGIETIVVFPEDAVPVADRDKLTVGLRIVLTDGITECEAVLRHGEDYEWVADIIEGTTRDIA